MGKKNVECVPFGTLSLNKPIEYSYMNADRIVVIQNINWNLSEFKTQSKCKHLTVLLFYSKIEYDCCVTALFIISFFFYICIFNNQFWANFVATPGPQRLWQSQIIIFISNWILKFVLAGIIIIAAECGIGTVFIQLDIRGTLSGKVLSLHSNAMGLILPCRQLSIRRPTPTNHTPSFVWYKSNEAGTKCARANV